MAVAAPVIVAEMADWVALGGGNSGIVGDPNHQYGFHLGANEVPASDYSRWRDPQGSDGPYVNWSYACAGDFRHGGREDLRAMHRAVLARLQRGELPMICEFIGQPWSDQPVLYWARWGGLSRYTGAGHDLWSHISWYRSMVDQPAGLWKPAPAEQQEDDMFTIEGSNGAYLVEGRDTQTGLPVATRVTTAQLADYRAAGIRHQKVNYVNPAYYAIRTPPLATATVDAAAVAAEVAKLLPKPPTLAEIEEATFRSAQRAEKE